jgi:hypothetical protein
LEEMVTLLDHATIVSNRPEEAPSDTVPFRKSEGNVVEDAQP